MSSRLSPRNWVQQLVERYEAEGAAAFEPHSRRPRRNPRAIEPTLEEHIVRLRKTLAKNGYDAGAATIAEHLSRDPSIAKVPAVATIWRILSRRGFVTPQPQKRPRSSWKRFEAELPNQCWQADSLPASPYQSPWEPGRSRHARFSNKRGRCLGR
jgi:hypothetical protein